MTLAGLTYDEEKAPGNDATMRARSGLESGTGSRKSSANVLIIV